ncbi:expressed unknown protein [Seminavis robusta]|uniref:Uncharacterized protein n=1 Tax=Seminavis robusta TaxID=568900 RepID=A0A9N8E9I9_9STRA|nr:expressed unknown protein [Seminavis robusta]|eukprot:Sro821_g207410.1 n/a (359) ;mRNA; r:35465-36541
MTNRQPLAETTNSTRGLGGSGWNGGGPPSIADLLKVMNERFDRVDERFDRVDERFDRVEFTLNPMSCDNFHAIPVIGAEAHTLTEGKQATYTWFDYGGTCCIVCAAHCAIPIATTGNCMFIELPQAITMLGVEGIYLVDPYNPDFKNPLPVHKDLIVIKVKSPPPSGRTLPQFTKVTQEKAKQPRRTRIVGRGLGSVVSSRDGTLVSTSNVESGGHLRFLLDQGEPGDSGTLLLVKDELGGFHARAIFCGIQAGLTPQHSRRGQATILPPLDCLTWLPVDPFQMNATGTVNVTCGVKADATIYLKNLNCSAIAKVAFGLNAVDLKDSNGTVKHGVFVSVAQQINYVGAADHYAMNGQL